VGLTVTRVALSGFRNYEDFELAPDRSLTVLVGPNAVGKTNLIEAIQLLTAVDSFRKPAWADVVRWGAEEARLVLEATGDDRRLVIQLRISRGGGREYRVNEKVRRRLVDVAGILPSVIFTPDDLRLVKDSAEKRRATLDMLGTQLSPAYSSMRAEYERLIKQRNAALREDGADEEQMRVYDEQLISSGSRFYESRTRLFGRLSRAMEEAHHGLVPGSELRPVYMASWQRDGLEEEDSAVAITRHLEMKRRDERVRRTSLVGPHRDEMIFLIDGKDARSFASQGQQRTVALAWKIAEVMVIEDISGQPPMLLLDDVMSELDERRRHALAMFVGRAAQTIMTTTNVGYFEKDLLSRACVVELS